jgi:hypothetical protein
VPAISLVRLSQASWWESQDAWRERDEWRLKFQAILYASMETTRDRRRASRRD